MVTGSYKIRVYKIENKCLYMMECISGISGNSGISGRSYTSGSCGNSMECIIAIYDMNV